VCVRYSLRFVQSTVCSKRKANNGILDNLSFHEDVLITDSQTSSGTLVSNLEIYGAHGEGQIYILIVVLHYTFNVVFPTQNQTDSINVDCFSGL